MDITIVLGIMLIVFGCSIFIGYGIGRAVSKAKPVEKPQNVAQTTNADAAVLRRLIEEHNKRIGA